MSPHWLRHAHATHAMEQGGAGAHLVKATLGHASVATTSKYLHARPDDSSALHLGRGGPRMLRESPWGGAGLVWVPGGAFVMGTARPVESSNVESSNDVSRDDAQSPQRTGPAEAGIAIRPATEHDHRGLARLLDATDDFHANALPALFRRPLPSERPPEAVVAGLRRSGAALLVAVAGTELVGLVQVSARDAPQLVAYQPRRYAFVEELVVLAPWQRRGVGRALMDAAHRWALEQGLREVELNVFAFNTAALGLYDRLGYRPQSLRLARRLP